MEHSRKRRKATEVVACKQGGQYLEPRLESWQGPDYIALVLDYAARLS